MFRRSLAALLASVVAVAVSLSVSPGAAHAVTSFTYYAGAQQTVSDSAVFANFGVGKPVLTAEETRSSAMLVARDASGNGVGIGWSVDPGRHGDDDPHLVVAWWKNNAGQCYNTDCPGFTAWSGAAMALGQKFTAGTPQRFGIQHSGSEWWLWAGAPGNVGSYIGYFGDANWTTAWPAFSKVQAYGELTTTALYPTAQMGNGLCAGNVNALTISSIAFNAGVTADLKTFATYAPAYSTFLLSPRTFRYGGSGVC